MNKMGKKLTDLAGEKRRIALASTNRLDDFKYPLEFPETNSPDVDLEIVFERPDTKKDKAYWTNIAIIACVKFSKLQPGESVGVKEIKKRFKQLRGAGYNVPAYENMNKTELWGCLRGIKRDVYSVLDRNYPNVKRQIDTINQRIR